MSRVPNDLLAKKIMTISRISRLIQWKYKNTMQYQLLIDCKYISQLLIEHIIKDEHHPGIVQSQNLKHNSIICVSHKDGGHLPFWGMPFPKQKTESPHFFYIPPHHFPDCTTLIAKKVSSPIAFRQILYQRFCMWHAFSRAQSWLKKTWKRLLGLNPLI